MDAAEEKFVTEEKERTNEIRVDVWTTTSSRVERRKGEDLSIRDPSYRNVHFGTMVKTRLLSLSLSVSRTISNLLFVPLSTTFFLPLLLLLATLLSISYRIFRIWISRKEVERSAPCRFFSLTVRINCNTLRIELIDRERNEISRTKKRKRKKEGKREREIARGIVSFLSHK